MISMIKGTLSYLEPNFIIVETAGIGYQIFVSPTTIATLPHIGEAVKIHTFMSVKDDGISLFGFRTRDELSMFNKLLMVSGIGPKGALALLSELNPSEIVLAILSDDIVTLSKAPGVGKKTAQRLILELKDKCKNEDAINKNLFDITTEDIHGAKLDTIEALVALGYSKSEASSAVSKIWQDGLSVENSLKLALKKIIQI